MTPLAAHSGIQLEAVWIEGAQNFALADRQRLLQVLINLVNNAIKYNRSGGVVQVEIGSSSNGQRRIEVRDTGPGISEEDKESLFQPFQRFGDTNIEGTGLGLALSRRFIDLMEGSVFLADSSPQGSTFVVELPSAEEPAVASLFSVRERVTGYQKDRRTGTVLCIEDNLANMRLIELLFEQWPGVRLIPVMQGLIGLEMARDHRPDLVLLDLHLPDIQGERVLWRLKSDPATESIPIVVLSADATAAQIEFAMEVGADEYMTKPIDLQRLVSVVHKHLGWSGAEG